MTSQSPAFHFQSVSGCSPSPRLFAYDCGSAPWLSGDGRSVSVLCQRRVSTSRDSNVASQCRKTSHLSSASLNLHQAGDNPALNRFDLSSGLLNEHRWV